MPRCPPRRSERFTEQPLFGKVHSAYTPKYPGAPADLARPPAMVRAYLRRAASQAAADREELALRLNLAEGQFNNVMDLMKSEYGVSPDPIALRDAIVLLGKQYGSGTDGYPVKRLLMGALIYDSLALHMYSKHEASCARHPEEMEARAQVPEVESTVGAREQYPGVPPGGIDDMRKLPEYERGCSNEILRVTLENATTKRSTGLSETRLVKTQIPDDAGPALAALESFRCVGESGVRSTPAVLNAQAEIETERYNVWRLLGMSSPKLQQYLKAEGLTFDAADVPEAPPGVARSSYSDMWDCTPTTRACGEQRGHERPCVAAGDPARPADGDPSRAGARGAGPRVHFAHDFVPVSRVAAGAPPPNPALPRMTERAATRPVAGPGTGPEVLGDQAEHYERGRPLLSRLREWLTVPASPPKPEALESCLRGSAVKTRLSATSSSAAAGLTVPRGWGGDGAAREPTGRTGPGGVAAQQPLRAVAPPCATGVSNSCTRPS